MIISYNSFENKLIEMLKIRSSNFVNTDCNMEVLIDTVYSNIMNDVNFDTTKTGYVLNEEKIFILKQDNYDPQVESIIATIRYGIATKIVDDEEVNVEDYMVILEDYIYRLDDSMFPNRYTDRTFYFYQPTLYSIELLPPKYYDEIFPAMIEGIMYEIEVSIPSEVDGKLSNMFYQRFFNEKEKLQKKHPKLDL